ncbi:MAG: shikimate dehydrogenase family protein [Lachnospiraceae bacterium]|jgi:shikimate dehydrogenase
MRVKYNLKTKVTFQVTGPEDRGAACMLHNSMYDFANINAVDLHIAVDKGRLKDVTDAVKNLGLAGFYLGMPHKSDVIEFLDEVDPVSRDFNCVNTVINRDGKLYGIGLDGIGMGMALEDELDSLKGKRVLIIGAGAVGGLIAADLCERGATAISVANRTEEKAETVAKIISKYYDVDISYGPLSKEYLDGRAAECDLLVQCSTIGNASHPGESFDYLGYIEKLPAGSFAADVNYPDTEVLRKAGAAGLKTLAGESMMYYQQIAAVKEMFGKELSKDCFSEGREAVAIAIALRQFYDC